MKFNVLILASLICCVTKPSERNVIDSSGKSVDQVVKEAETLLNTKFGLTFLPKLTKDIAPQIKANPSAREPFQVLTEACLFIAKGKGYKGKNDGTIYQAWIKDFKIFTENYCKDFIRQQNKDYFEFDQRIQIQVKPSKS